MHHLVWRERGVISWCAADRASVQRIPLPERDRYDREVSHPCRRRARRRQPQFIEFDGKDDFSRAVCFKSSFRGNVSRASPAVSLGALRLRGAEKMTSAQIKFPFASSFSNGMRGITIAGAQSGVDFTCLCMKRRHFLGILLARVPPS